jgi:site-specific recombinase XerD
VSCALRFFYGVTFGRQEAFARIAIAKEPKKLPVVLSADEIVRFLQAVPGLRSRAALTTAYGAGLGVSEVASLSVGDIDSGRMLIRVEHGKGQKCYVKHFCPLPCSIRSSMRSESTSDTFSATTSETRRPAP